MIASFVQEAKNKTMVTRQKTNDFFIKHKHFTSRNDIPRALENESDASPFGETIHSMLIGAMRTCAYELAKSPAG